MMSDEEKATETKQRPEPGGGTAPSAEERDPTNRSGTKVLGVGAQNRSRARKPGGTTVNRSTMVTFGAAGVGLAATDPNEKTPGGVPKGRFIEGEAKPIEIPDANLDEDGNAWRTRRGRATNDATPMKRMSADPRTGTDVVVSEGFGS
jgi:hypothetical protein